MAGARLRSFVRDTNGSMILWAAGLTAVAVFIVGGVVDYMSLAYGWCG
jgi:hypothetical protein